MSKVIAVFKNPEDMESFDRTYFQDHLALVAKVPGLQKTVVTRFTRKLMGDDLYLMLEMIFSDKDALVSAMRSEEWIAVGNSLDTFAKGLVTLMLGFEEEASINPSPGSIMPQA